MGHVQPVVVQFDVHVPDNSSDDERGGWPAQQITHSTTMAIGNENSPDAFAGLMAQVQFRSVLYPDLELFASLTGGGGDPSVK